MGLSGGRQWEKQRDGGKTKRPLGLALGSEVACGSRSFEGQATRLDPLCDFWARCNAHQRRLNAGLIAPRFQIHPDGSGSRPVDGFWLVPREEALNEVQLTWTRGESWRVRETSSRDFIKRLRRHQETHQESPEAVIKRGREGARREQEKVTSGVASGAHRFDRLFACRLRLQASVAGFGCRRRLQASVAGVGCRLRLQASVAGFGCRLRPQLVGENEWIRSTRK